MSDPNPNLAYAAWIEELASTSRFGKRDRLGSANFIDDKARRRAADVITTGRCTSLALPLTVSTDETPGEGMLTVEVTRRQSTSSRGLDFGGVVDSASDILHVAAHGQRQTHLDGINHYGREGTWYSGFPVDDPDGPDIASLADHKLFTRAVLADIPAVRGTDWVDPAEPVTGEDIEAALARVGTTFEKGDALLLYMGRDRFEASGHRLDLVNGDAMPGAGEGAARWIADHGVSLLCWDFLDALCAGQPLIPVHLLIWAIGQILVDNCVLGPLADNARSGGAATGALVVAPPPIPEVTGCLVSPLLLQ